MTLDKLIDYIETMPDEEVKKALAKVEKIEKLQDMKLKYQIMEYDEYLNELNPLYRFILQCINFLLSCFYSVVYMFKEDEIDDDFIIEVLGEEEYKKIKNDI